MKKTVMTVTAICLAAVLLCGGICLGTVSYVRQTNASLSAAAAPAERAALPADAGGYVSTAFARAGTAAPLSATEIYDLACRQVVGISTTVTGYNMFGQLSSNAVSGTGFILSADGYILTNYHVVEDARRSGADGTVKLYDGSEYPAVIVGVEGTQSDIALLKIEAEGLTPVTLGNSDDMKVGEQAYVVGNPLGELTYTLTSGIISALDREIATERNVRVHMFQLDAAINSGNSGGPVYNERGEVIGVVTAKYKAAGIEGLGFAIPVNTAKAIAETIKENGYVSKPYFGIVVTNQKDQEPQEAQEAQEAGVVGVVVVSVNEGSCAEKAGIEAGDLIVEMDGKTVETKEDISEVKKNYRPGDECQVKIYRNGEYQTLTVTFDEEPPEGVQIQLPQTELQPSPSVPEGGETPRMPENGMPFDSFEDWMNEFFGSFFDYFGGEPRENYDGGDSGSEEGGSSDGGSSSEEGGKRGFRHFG